MFETLLCFYCASTSLQVQDGGRSPEGVVLVVDVVLLEVADGPVSVAMGTSGGGGALRVAVGGVLFRWPLCGAEGLRRGYITLPREDMKLGVCAKCPSIGEP